MVADKKMKKPSYQLQNKTQGGDLSALYAGGAMIDPHAELCQAHSFVEFFFALSLIQKEQVLSVTNERMGTQYWLIASGRLAHKQCG